MADNVAITAGSGTIIATDQVGTDHYQKVKLTDGTPDSSTTVYVDIGAKANALRVVPANNITDETYIGDIKFGESLPAGTALLGKVGIDQVSANANEVVVKSGTVTAVTAITNALPAGTNAIGKLAANDGVDIGNVDVASVPAPLSVVGGGTEATAMRVTIASDSTGVLSIDDNGAALTVDGTVTANAGTNLNTSALALEAGGNLATVATNTTSIDGKITACNTGAVVVASGTVTAVTSITNAVAVTNAGITSIDGKITACNTGAVVLAAGTAGIGKLTANDGVDIGNVDVASIAAGDNNIGNVDIVSVAVGLTKAVASVDDWTAVAQNTIVEGTTVDLSAVYESILHIQAFLDSATAHTGTEFIVQISSNSTGDEDWENFIKWTGLIGTSNVEAIVDNPLAAAATTINLADTTGYTTLGVYRAIEDGTLANSELVFQKSVVTNDLITIVDGVTNEHAQNTNMYSVAEVYTIALPIGIYRARLLVNNTYDADGSTLNFKDRVVKITKV